MASTYSALQSTPETTTAGVRRRSSAAFQTISLSEALHELAPSDAKKYDHLPTLESKDDVDSDQDSVEAVSVSKEQGVPSFSDYCGVLVRYPMFRWYLISHICQHMGDIFVRIASLLVVEEISSKGSALSNLILSVMVPKVIFAQLGGYLADNYDRRKLMVIMDVLSGVVVIGYLAAVQRQSLDILYVITMLRSAIGSAYYPVTTGLVPLLIPNARDLQLAVTVNGWAWSGMALTGGLLAGSATAVIGLQACYILDMVTYLVSAAAVFFFIHGDFNVKIESDSVVPPGTNLVQQSYNTVKQVGTYLATCGFGLLVLLKASAGLVWGAEDVIGVEFSTVRDANGQEDQEASSWRTGLLFSCIGIGWFLGPTLINIVTDANRPYTLQRACLIGLVVLTLGWVFISQAPSFAWFLWLTIFRTAGSGMVWVNATLTLQTLVEKDILGRVLAVEFTMYTLLEGLSATATGRLFDDGLDKNQLALVGAALGTVTVVLWGVYHAQSFGAADPKFNQVINEKASEVSSLEIELSSSLAPTKTNLIAVPEV